MFRLLTSFPLAQVVIVLNLSAVIAKRFTVTTFIIINKTQYKCVGVDFSFMCRSFVV